MDAASGRGVAALKRWAVRSGLKVLVSNGTAKQEKGKAGDRECLNGG